MKLRMMGLAVVLLQLCLTNIIHAAVDWPVFFEYLGSVNSIHNKWDLTFKIDTNFAEFEEIIKDFIKKVDLDQPTFPPEDISSRSVDGSIELTKNSPYNKVKEHWEKVAESMLRRADKMKEKLEDIKTLGDNRRTRVMEKKRRMKNRMKGSKKRSSDMKSKDRVKRQIQAPGLLQLLFGVAYTDNVQQVKNELEDIQRKMNSDIGNLVNEQNRAKADMSTKIKTTDDKVEKMTDMTENLENKFESMERDGLLKSPSQSLMDKSSRLLQELDAELAECETYLAELERILITLAGGRLPPTLVPASLLRRHLKKVSKSLPEGFVLLYPAHESLWPYYSVVSTSIYFSQDFNTMYVQISVPLQDFGTDLKLYRVHNLPLKVRNGYSVTADIDTEYLLTAKKGDYHLELKKEDFQDCQTFQKDGQNFFCGFPPLLKSSEHQTCVIQLFNVEGDGAMCQSKVTHGLVQPFNRLYNGSWVFAALNAQVPVVMKCPNNTLTTSLLGFGVINLLEGCTLSSDNYMYPHTFSGFTDIDLALEVGLESHHHHHQHGSASQTTDSFLEYNGQDYDISEYGDYNLQGLHQIGDAYDDYDDFETMIISAVVAEQEQSLDGLDPGSVDENYFSFDKSAASQDSSTSSEEKTTSGPILDVTTLLDSSEEQATESQEGAEAGAEAATTTPSSQQPRNMVY